MKALVYHGAGKKHWETKAPPQLIESTDAIVRIIKTTICGTDLHILKGDVPTVDAGRTLGHEGIGIVESVGESVHNIKVGDKVIISCITVCGRCRYCKRQLYSHCEDGGWILGHKIDGTQSEKVRIPYADNSLHRLPEGIDEEAALMLSDILPTGLEIGVINGKVQPGNTIALIGAGPVGLSALLASQFYSPVHIIMIDTDDNRLHVAQQFGADTVINPTHQNVVEVIQKLTDGIGVDVAIECVGIPATFKICQDIITAGGYIANVGVHGKSVELHLEDLWIKNITITTGLVNTSSTPMLLKSLQSGKISPEKLVTHRYSLSEIETAYEVFGNAEKEKALKIVLTAE
ncbi:zinc-dependent alcohol dehydrogenase family protein [Xenorhabdus bovienii]|uniref:Zinc-dependent alcohol dehydrogenase family protein n=1 Tax=Xenorhabdus bovienii TaxID=40576 RepID=A0AAJ1J962_XENBV|nr:zinc-dependent alcohol dehydrogenase family protein [Xenorhabdus bovienii]MDE1479211.1 zinc-dependent alcohol dehydrogenase family protein [Xenorhabdus bovienii]MDE1491583.1 zinc-dependent alcohol dehydrogenase family protein [Xenorhabdus bovienii]MDE1495833.1 zinc-dependent alcohol dehydrogenase family protein [Xenorhabdus bovienii]MDE9510910.1 zinc-dependent alcohol dehydrogenase family protein [Xenorhabdus bovienii]MDE9522547.1 zinc-dependent alcohol dehydrogenase family protein [Xenorha